MLNRRLLCLTISLLALLPSLAQAYCVGTSRQLVVPVSGTLTISGPADANLVGKQIAGWGGSVTDLMAFAVDTCSPAAENSYAIPSQNSVAGLTHVSDGVSYPVYPTAVPGVGYVLGIKDPHAT